jgi:hypothetical protein
MKVSVLRTRPDGVTDVAELDANSGGPGRHYDRRDECAWIPKTQAEWTAARLLDPSRGPQPRPAWRAWWSFI